MSASQDGRRGLRLAGRGLVVLAPAARRGAAQTPAEIQAALDAAYAKYKDLKEGKNADYIPALAKVDSNIYGIALVTTDGKVYTAGDIKSEVSIQSISKVFTHGEGHRGAGPGRDREARSASTRPACASTRSSSIEFSQKALGGPEMNPLVNPGAIATTSMVQGRDPRRGLEEHPRLLLRLRRPAAHGQPGGLQVGGRHQPAQPGDRLPDVRLRLHQGRTRCRPPTSTPSSARSASTRRTSRRWRRTLANGGKNPVTGKQVMKAENVPEVLAVMATAGPLRRLGQVALPHRPARQERRGRRPHRRLARASSASRWSRRRSTRPATACGRRRRSPTSRTRSAATRWRRSRASAAGRGDWSRSRVQEENRDEKEGHSYLHCWRPFRWPRSHRSR